MNNFPLSSAMDGEYPLASTELQKLPVEIAEIEATSRIVHYTTPRSAAADRFRVLRMRLGELQAARAVKSLLITSPYTHDGKSTVTLNLATVLAERGKKSVLVIEGDLHRPTLTTTLGLNASPGFAECLLSGRSPMVSIRRIEPLSWYLLPAGLALDNPSELLQTEALPACMRKLARVFDWILVDSPPVEPLIDTLSLAKHTDASLLVVRAGRTPRRALEDAVSLLGQHHVAGLVLNGVEGVDNHYLGYGYY